MLRKRAVPAAALAAVLLLTACGSRSGSGSSAGSSSSAGSASGSGSSSGQHVSSLGQPVAAGYSEVPETVDYRMAVLEQDDETMAVVLQFPVMADFKSGAELSIAADGEEIEGDGQNRFSGSVCTDEEDCDKHTVYFEETHDMRTYTFLMPVTDPEGIAVTGSVEYRSYRAGDNFTRTVGVLENQEMTVNAEPEDLSLQQPCAHLYTPVRLGSRWYMMTPPDSGISGSADTSYTADEFMPVTGEADADELLKVLDGHCLAWDRTEGSTAVLPDGWKFVMEAEEDDGKIVIRSGVKVPESDRETAGSFILHMDTMYTAEDSTIIRF